MKAIGHVSFAVLAALLASTALMRPALAGVSMTVLPLVTELNVAPGSSQSVQLIVRNNSADAERVTIKHTDWRTTSDGSTMLEKTGAEKGHSLTRDLSLSSYQFRLEPEENRTITMTLRVPRNAAGSRSYWGGFLISSNAANAPPSAVGIGATVFVYNNIGMPRRHLTLQSMRIISDARGNATLIARMRNDAEGYARVRGRLLVESAGRILNDSSPALSVIFPSSTRILKQPLGHLAQGDYRFELTLDYGGNSIIDGVTTAHIK